jgi:hypothetical protein
MLTIRAINSAVKLTRPKEPTNPDEVDAIVKALPPGTRVGQVGDTVASNVVREGGVHKAKKMTFNVTR